MDQDYSATEPARKKRHKWTDDDQHKAELLREAGVGYGGIAKLLGASKSTVRRHLSPEVAEVQRVQHREWNERNRESQKIYYRSYYEQNKETVNAYGKNYYQQNGETLRLKDRMRYKRNEEEYRAKNRANYSRNIEKRRLSSQKWRGMNPEQVREQGRRRNVTKRASRRRALSPLTITAKNEIFTYFDNLCAYCGISGVLTIDHILPLSRGGLDEAGNIVPACKSCNSSKYVSPVEEWYQRQPFFSVDRWQRIKAQCPCSTTGQLSIAVPL